MRIGTLLLFLAFACGSESDVGPRTGPSDLPTKEATVREEVQRQLDALKKTSEEMQRQLNAQEARSKNILVIHRRTVPLGKSPAQVCAEEGEWCLAAVPIPTYQYQMIAGKSEKLLVSISGFGCEARVVERPDCPAGRKYAFGPVKWADHPAYIDVAPGIEIGGYICLEKPEEFDGAVCVEGGRRPVPYKLNNKVKMDPTFRID